MQTGPNKAESVVDQFIAGLIPPRRYPIEHTANGTRYGPWRIYYDPKPGPNSRADWSFTHEDFDASYEGEEDGWVGNGLCGTSASFADALNECDEIDADRLSA